MNHLGMTLVTVAVQVTLATIPAMIVVAVTGRRNPRTAATFSIVALVLCFGLTATAFAPSPPWREWFAEVGRAAPAGGISADETATMADRGASGLGIPLRRLVELLPAIGPSRPEDRSWSAWAWLAAIVLAGTALAVFRLTTGFCTVVACRARSGPIGDLAVRRLLDELRNELDCRPAVDVRASAAVGTAATVGWRRPTILLADDWPTWTGDELRAVLAHELAHVRRRDYAAALLAGLCRAVHFYHPFVAWLAGRLRLHQELAADAVAADAVGGRTAYLVALARMALRQERFCVAGAARPFLSDRNSLLRRIAMLRITDDRRGLSKGARWGLAAVLIGAALAASVVRGTAQAPAKTETTAAGLAPLDLCYVPEKSDGVFILRPAGLLARPEMKPVLENWNRFATDALRATGITLAIDLAEIDLLVGPFELRTMTDEEVKKNGRPERHSVIMGLAMVRMTRDYDWPELLKALAPMVETKAVKPGTFECLSPAFGPHPFTVHTPDARTLVLAVPGQPVVKTDSTAERWGTASKRVERAGYAVLLDNRTGRWTRSLADEKEIAPAVAVLGTPAHLAFGVNWGECVSATCAADWTTEPAATDVARGEATIRGLIEAALKTVPIGDATDRLVHDLVSQSLKSARVRRDGKVVTVETDSAVRWHDLLKMIPLDGKAQADVKTIEK